MEHSPSLSRRFSSSVSISSDLMAEEPSESKSICLVCVEYPKAEEHEAFHIRTLASVVGSEEAAEDAVVYHYEDVFSGFAARLTAKQIEEITKQPGVLQVMPEQIYVASVD